MTRNVLILTPLAVVACAALALEVSQAVGDGAVDRVTVDQAVHRIVIDAEDGDVRLVPAAGRVEVRVERSHLVNTPSTTRRVRDGVLTLRTTCPVGFVACRSDYRVAVPPGVRVDVRKASGRVDATAVGAGVTSVSGDMPSVRRQATFGPLSVRGRDGGRS